MLLINRLGRTLAGLLFVSFLAVLLPAHPASFGVTDDQSSASDTGDQSSASDTSDQSDVSDQTVEATQADPKDKDPKEPKKRYRPKKGPLFNNPMGPPEARFRIERHILKAINHVKKGERIRISAYSLDRIQVADALIRAHKRGVKVQVLLNDHIVPFAQRKIAAVLGRKTKKANFLYRCDSGCRAQKTEYNNLHSKFYLFSKTGKSENVVMLGSHNMTLNAVRWQWNDLWTGREQPVLYQYFVDLFNDMRKDYDVRQPPYEFCDTSPVCDLATNKHYNWVFPKVSTQADDVIMQILNNVQCTYADPVTGETKRTILRLSMHTMRGNRGDYIADKIRNMYAEGCDFKVQYGLMGFYTKGKIGAPTPRGRIPLRSTGFDLDPDKEEDPLEEVERYTHQKYLVIRGSWMNNPATDIVFTGSSNWASLGTPQDEIIFTIRGTKTVDKYLKNWNFMWKPPHSRDAYTTTYSNWRVFSEVNGRMVSTIVPRKTVTVEPDGYVGAGPTWEDD
ncbi:phospholipase D-like domain-containing protein [Nocardioides bigeumensis]|uniref:phospholipase D n=1 Tax=Nocardioides bigeumensis TaxID=433657 RepID=A0ABN2YG22_9ACTN